MEGGSLNGPPNSGKRLVGANQLQHDIPVDPSRGFAGSKLNVGDVEMPYRLRVLPLLHRTLVSNKSVCTGCAARASG